MSVDVIEEKIIKLKDVAKKAWSALESRDELEVMVADDLEIDGSRLDVVCLETPKIHHKYIKILLRTKEVLHQFEHIESSMHKKLFLYYSGKTKPAYPIRVARNDIRLLIEGNDVYNDVAFQLHLVNDRLRYLQSVIDEINKRNFHISNIIKFNKFKNGEMN